jgi:hypothetical protein
LPEKSPSLNIALSLVAVQRPQAFCGGAQARERGSRAKQHFRETR